MLSQEEQWLLEEGFGGEKSAAFFAASAELKAGTPLAYLIGHVPFLNCRIYLDSKPLIPRPETEFWTEKAIAEIEQRQRSGTETILRILDLCAGSGCVGVAVAKAVTQAQVDFIELEESHLPTILKNCLENGLRKENFRILSGNLFSPLTTETYDFILTNPPYIDPKVDRAEKSVKDHEPHLALYGGDKGMELLTKIIETAPQFLRPRGQLWLEHEPEQAENITKLAKTNFKVHTHNDQYNTTRFTQLIMLQ